MKPMLPEGLERTLITPFLVMFSPLTEADKSELGRLCRENHDYFMDQVNQHGGILFRGFTAPGSDKFDLFVNEQLQLAPWNSFNSKGTPTFVANWLRKWSEKILGAGDYRRYLGKSTVRLGPVENSIQGPHVEGGGLPQRSRYLALCCQQPGEYQAETGMADFSSVIDRLPAALQEKFLKGWNKYSYTTARPLGWLDKLILNLSPMAVEVKEDGHGILTGKLCPAACYVPETDSIAVQPWSFARNANGQVHKAAQAVFHDRGEIIRDSTADALNMNWDLVDENGDSLGWSEEEQYQFFHTIFSEAHLMAWQKGDVALIDNVRLGHWRMNGIQGNRQLIQVQANPFNVLEHLVHSGTESDAEPALA